MASEDISFLKDQVQRLNATLAEYQNKYPLLGQPKQDGTAPDVPWVADRNLMSPLLAEYDSNSQQLTEQLRKYNSEIKDLHSQVDKLVAENNRLSKELKDTVENQLQHVSEEGQEVGGQSGTEPAAEEQVLHNLQHQLQMAVQEKDTALEMWHAAITEVERMEKYSQHNQFNPKLQALERQANQIKEQYVRTVAELNNEITSLQEELQLSRNEHKLAQNQAVQLRKTLEDLRKQLIIQETEITDVEGGKRMLDHKAGDMKRKIISFETELKQQEIECTQLKHDKAFLEQRVGDLQKKSTENETRAYEVSVQLRENSQAAESALLEKDEVERREKTANEEIGRLQEALSSVLNQAGARTRQEVDTVRQQCNENLSALMEELHNLELENSENKGQIERIVREKRAAESELEKIYKDGMIQGQKESTTIEELNRRACDAERMRDEALVKMDSMENEIKRMEMTLRQEKSHLSAELEQLKDRLSLMNQEFELANGDRVRLTEKIDEHQRKLLKAQQERDGAQRHVTKQLTCLNKDHKIKEKDYEVRLQATEDTHRRAMSELRQMLSSQQRMSAKWKEECQTMTSKFEVKVQELREELKREKHRNGEVTKLLKESRDKTMETESMMTEYTRNIKSLENRVRAAENRAANSALQFSKTRHPERDIVEDRKQLKRELERTLRESKLSQDSGPEPLAMSDLLGDVDKVPSPFNGRLDGANEVTAR